MANREAFTVYCKNAAKVVGGLSCGNEAVRDEDHTAQ